MAKRNLDPTQAAQGVAEDRVTAEVRPGAGTGPTTVEENPAPAPEAEAAGVQQDPAAPPPKPVQGDPGEALGALDLGTSLKDIATPEHAMVVLKEKVGLLHTLAHNVGHYGALAFNEVEQLVVDIQRIAAYIRSKTKH